MWRALGLGVSALTAAPFIADTADDLSQWSSKKKTEINRMSDPEFEDYRPGWFDKTFLGVDPTKIEGHRDAYIQKNAEEDGNYISARQLVTSNNGTWNYTPGQTASQAIAANSNAITQATTAQKVKDVVTASNAGHNTLAKQYERGVQRDATDLANRRFNYTMKTNEQNRLDQRADSAEQRADTIRMQIRADERSDKRYNQQLAERDRRDRRAAIGDAAGGLAALAAAFAM